MTMKFPLYVIPDFIKFMNQILIWTASNNLQIFKLIDFSYNLMFY